MLVDAFVSHPLVSAMFGAVLSASSGALGGVAAKPPYDGILAALLEAFIFLANLAGGLVVGIAVVRGLVLYARNLFSGGAEIPSEGIRLSLGRSLALALEFQLGADILGTALDPNLQDIILLGAIVVLRTVLNYFLGRELESAERRARPAQGAAPR